MTLRGRKPLAAGHVEHLSGSELAKQRLEMILRTMLGELTVAQACERLDIGESRFHALRNQWMQGALELLEPRPMGRPPKVVTEEASRVAVLEAALREREEQLHAARVRQEIAEILPRRDAAPAPEVVKGGSRRRGRRRPR